MLVDWLIRRAKRTPYFHLDGYMERDWLVPYKRFELNAKVIKQFRYETTDVPTNTGPLSWRKRPISRAIQETGIAIRVHKILRSDLGRHPHSHPWPYLSIILRGWYFEERFNNDGTIRSGRWHGPGSIIFRPAGSWHILTLEDGWGFGDPIPVTTLFITGKKSQSWGYNVDGKQVNHLDYDGRM